MFTNEKEKCELDLFFFLSLLWILWNLDFRHWILDKFQMYKEKTGKPWKNENLIASYDCRLSLLLFIRHNDNVWLKSMWTRCTREIHIHTNANWLNCLCLADWYLVAVLILQLNSTISDKFHFSFEYVCDF